MRSLMRRVLAGSVDPDTRLFIRFSKWWGRPDLKFVHAGCVGRVWEVFRKRLHNADLEGVAQGF